jgi:uncharacterized membrane protein YdjX (TVP38/TMEM64 family)
VVWLKLLPVLRLTSALGLLAAAVLLLVTTPFGEHLWGLFRDPSPARLSQLLADTPMWLPVLLVGLMILHTLVPVPAELLALAAGMALGPVWGTVTIWIGAMLGAYVGFFLARALGQPFLRHMVSPARLERLQHWLQQTDVPLLLAVRLLPLISFNLVNFALGLSAIGWWRFTWTTAVGIVPVTVCVVAFGAHLDDWRILLLVTLAACLVGWIGYRFWRTRRRRYLPES